MEKLLSQEEIDALLHGIEDGVVNTEVKTANNENLVSFDFTRQDQFIYKRLPNLDNLNNALAKNIGSSLSLTLRRAVDVSAKPKEIIRFGDLISRLPLPSSLHIFKMEPLNGYALLVLEAKLVFTLIDIFLGGHGKIDFKVEGRDFSNLELQLIHKLITIIFNDLEKSWSNFYPIKTKYLRSEINPQYVQILPTNDLIVVNPFLLELEQFSGTINVCLPYSSLDPIKDKFYSAPQREQHKIDENWRQRILENLYQTEVSITVELGKGALPLQKLAQLQIGDLIPLNNRIGDLLIAKVEGVPKFLGQVGIFGNNKAFQIEGAI